MSRVNQADFYLIEQRIYFYLGFPAVLSCQISGSPPPVIIWHKIDRDNKKARVRTNDTIEILLSDWSDGHMTSSLNIDNVSRTDYGHYVCTASNSQGMVCTQIINTLSIKK